VVREANLLAADTIDAFVEFVEPARPCSECRDEIPRFSVTADNANVALESPQSQRERECDQEADERNTGDDRQGQG
jgi:hypothetical protein